MKPIALITGEAHAVLATGLTHLGYEIIYEPQITSDELTVRIGDVEALILTSRLYIDKALFDKAKKLRWIGRLGSGLDVIDLDAAAKNQVQVLSSPEGNRQAVAEHTLGLVLNLIRHQTRSDRQIREGIWKRNENRGYELSGLTVGLIGYGNTGECTARLLTSVGMRVLAYDKYKIGFGGEWATECDLERICQEADLVSLHLPLTSETEGLITDEWIGRFSKPIWLINTSRGAITPLDPLIRQLEAGRLRGLAMDVLPREPLSGYTEEEKQTLSRLCSFENVVLTPHVAGYSVESPERMARILLEKLISSSPGGGGRVGAESSS